MDIQLVHPDFEARPLSVRTSAWGAASLVQAGQLVNGKKGSFRALKDDGSEARVEFMPRFLDPVPNIAIDGRRVVVAEPFAWYEYIWMGAPMLLMYMGGALGGLVGGFATYTNGRVLRNGRSPLIRYGLSGLITLSAALAWLIVAVVIRLMVGPVH